MFSYENKKNPYQFFFPTFELYEVSNFTSGWAHHCSRQESRDGRAVMSIQECQSCDFSIPRLLFCFLCVYAEEENCVDENMNGIVKYSE